MSKDKKKFAPTIKLWETKRGGSYKARVGDKSFNKVQEILDAVKPGAMILVRPVSDAYREMAGENAPAFELSVISAEEMEAFDSSNQSDGI